MTLSVFPQRARISQMGDEKTSAARTRLLWMLVLAMVFAAVDQWVKLSVTTPYWAYHHRSDVWFVGSCMLLVGAAALTLVPSRMVAIGAALLAGGVLGNVLSASADGFDVPNPLFIGHNYGIAFNVADVLIVVGNITLMLSLSAVVIRNREQLEASRAAFRRAVREHF